MMRDRNHAPGAGGTDRWTGLLSAYLDGELPHAERLGLEDHLAACPRCAGALADLRLLLDEAPLLEAEEQPAADLWPAIRGRLRRRRRWGWVRGVADRGRPHALASWRPAVAAAAMVVLVVAASLLWLWRGGPSPPGEERAAAGDAAPVAPLEARPHEATPEYYDTLAGLWRQVRENLTHDPRVVEVLEQNLEVLDGAIAQYGDALAEHPGDARLAGRLDEARKRKLDVLRQAADLSTEAGN